MTYEFDCETCGEQFAAQRSTAKYCSGACRQEAYRERKESGYIYPEEELSDLRKQISDLVAFAEFHGDEPPPLAMVQNVRDPELVRIAHAMDQLHIVRVY